jgi:hypothetical protein
MNGITTPVDLQTSACSIHGHFSIANFDLTDSKDSAFYRTKVKTSALVGAGEGTDCGGERGAGSTDWPLCKP